MFSIKPPWKDSTILTHFSDLIKQDDEDCAKEIGIKFKNLRVVHLQEQRNFVEMNQMALITLILFHSWGKCKSFYLRPHSISRSIDFYLCARNTVRSSRSWFGFLIAGVTIYKLLEAGLTSLKRFWEFISLFPVSITSCTLALASSSWWNVRLNSGRANFRSYLHL